MEVMVFWCSCTGHKNNSADDGINHTFVAVNINEDMLAVVLFIFFFFLAFLVNSVIMEPCHP